jgi:hypothetical protein
MQEMKPFLDDLRQASGAALEALPGTNLFAQLIRPVQQRLRGTLVLPQAGVGRASL